jgi:hypothetical protein
LLPRFPFSLSLSLPLSPSLFCSLVPCTNTHITQHNTTQHNAAQRNITLVLSSKSHTPIHIQLSS